MWYPDDPPELRWSHADPPGELLGHIILHLIREEWWRRTGEWVGMKRRIRPGSASGRSPAVSRHPEVGSSRHVVGSMAIVLGAVSAVADLAAAAQWVSVVLPAAVAAAVVAGTVNVWLARSKGRDEERARVRTLLAEAFQTYADYREFP